ncbi:MAG: endolytic transglycosylase MltG [Anaerosolibacter sp.]|jgi:cell division protein YceG involved in septum cleavage|nr:endolytic transglycosylase MltG [Anaerosolibacter sp.]
MFEKFKDLLYEASDVLLAFVIILVMSTVITWKVSDSLAFSTDKLTNGEPVAAQQNSPSNEVASEETPTEIASEDLSQSQTSSNNESPSLPEEPQASPVLETVVTAVVPQPQPTTIQVDIPNGTPGSGIANILKQKGLIDNTAKFIARIQELKLEAKLKSGKFSVPSDASLDDVIYTITGTKRSSS